MRKQIEKLPILNFFNRHRKALLILSIFMISFSLRAYGIGSKYPFGWDQVDNAWTAKNIIIDHEFPLVGMVAKGNTGFFIGPIYYYFVAFFYSLTDLNPVASNYIALISGTFTFFIIFYVVKKIFSFKIALIACLVNSFTAAGFYFDSVQWPVSLLPGISFLILYFLYKLLKGEEKYIFFLALMVGLAFHLHFTAVFFPIIILLSLPFFPWSKKLFSYLLLSIPLFLIWFIPNLISQMQNNSQLGNLSNYLSIYYHGFHLRRFIQLTGDGLIQFDPFLSFATIKPFKVLLLPIFLLIFLRKNINKDSLVFSYLIVIFFLVPWLVFSTYKGEISDYYFSVNRFVALMVLSYLGSRLICARNFIIRIIFLGFFSYYLFFNINIILNYNDIGDLRYRFEKVKSVINSNQQVRFQEGVPESYIYYYLMRKKGIIVY